MFYEKIKVPAPTFCPWCRMIRRMMWRNERSLYRRACAATGQNIISCFSPESGLTVYDRDYWWGDDWNPMDYGLEFDPAQSFLAQFGTLMKTVPFPAVYNGKCTNSPYSNHVGEMKNAYLTFASWIGENVLYGSKTGSCTNVADVTLVTASEMTYETILGKKLYKVCYSQNCENCTDSYFLYDCKNCTNCFGCSNLRNKNYCIWNKQYTREEYFKALEALNIESYASLTAIAKEFDELVKNGIHKYANITNSQNSTGDNMANVINCKNCFDLWDTVRNCKYSINGGMNMDDSYDGYGVGAKTDLEYEVVDSGDNSSHLVADLVVWNCSNVEYSINCQGSNDCFGCIGLRKKQYCILNRQYTKEEYTELLPKIKEHMTAMPYEDAFGRSHGYGEFFPGELSPFGYNETIAQEYEALSKEDILTRGYRWHDESAKTHVPTVLAADLPDTIAEVPDSFVSEVIGCPNAGNVKTQCTAAFKITGEELQLYKRLKVPLPRYCPNCRHYRRIALRNPMKLWARTCMCEREGHDHAGKCPNGFETSYAPERPETIYCESCYQKEVL